MGRRVLVALILIPLVLASILYFPLFLFLLLVSLVSLLGQFELFHMIRRLGLQDYPMTYLFVTLLPWAWCYWPLLVLPLLVLSVLGTVVWSIVNGSEMRSVPGGVSINLMAVLYLGLPLAILAGYHPGSAASAGSPSRAWELMLILAVVWVSDSAAYFTGRLAGRHRIVPRISPSKTLEGFAAGLLAPALLAALLGSYFLEGVWSVPQLCLIGIVVAAGGIAGDLFESMLKRGVEVKDSSRLIPGHGGMLDRIDSLLLAGPAYYLLSILIK